MRLLHIVEDTPMIIHGKNKKNSMTGFLGPHRPSCPLTLNNLDEVYDLQYFLEDLTWACILKKLIMSMTQISCATLRLCCIKSVT
jgi:hypothetical protein